MKKIIETHCNIYQIIDSRRVWVGRGPLVYAVDRTLRIEQRQEKLSQAATSNE